MRMHGCHDRVAWLRPGGTDCTWPGWNAELAVSVLRKMQSCTQFSGQRAFTRAAPAAGLLK
eukprot:1019154-Prymnesium_polylepis.2